MIKIAIDTQSVMPQSTGIGYYTKNLIDKFSNVNDMEFFYYRHPRLADMNTLQRVGWESFSLPSLAKKDRVDILHIPGFAGPIQKVRFKKVTTVHDLIGLIYPQNLAPISRFYWQKWLPACVRNSDIIIADSDNTREDIIKFLKVAPEKIKVVYLAASENFKPLPKTDSQKSQLKRYGIARRYILNVGTIEPRKNIPLLIEAFGGYIKESKQNSLLLVIAGKKGWDYQRCLQKVKEVGLEDNVIFCNYVADNDLPLLYNFAEVFICPSFYEGFGLPVLEAMCCGAPVICSNRSSLPEVAADAACYIEPDSIDSIKSAIKRLMEDNTLREDLSKKALERSKKFSWTETANKTLDIYREILN